MHSADSIRPQEQGNVLFLILIAVALFAALSYAVTQSSRNSFNDTKSENVKNKASLILGHVANLRSTALRLKMTNGCSSEQLAFESAPYTDSNIYTQYPNSKAPSNKSCHMFHPSGGGIADLKPSTIAPGAAIVYMAGCPVNVPPYEMIYAMAGINRELCIELNKAVGYNPPSYAPTQLAWSCNAVHATGDMTTYGSIPSLNSASTGCVLGVNAYYYGEFGSGASTYWFFSGFTAR